MKNILRAFALPLIALALFVMPGEARAWSQSQWTPAVSSPLTDSWNGLNRSLSVFVRYNASFSDGAGSVSLTPNKTININTTTETKFNVFPSETRTSYYSCTENNAAVNVNCYNLDSPSRPGMISCTPTFEPVFCVPDPGWGNYVGGTQVRSAWGHPYGAVETGNIEQYPWTTVTVIQPMPTVTSSDSSVISCSGTSCTSKKAGSASLTVTYPATTSVVWWARFCFNAGCNAAYHDTRDPVSSYSATVPAITTSIPITVSPVAPPPNQIPTANITAPIVNPTTATQGDSLPFSGTGTDSDGAITQYEWTYGTCGTGTLISSNQSFDLNTVAGFPTSIPGTVYFRVKDNQGAWSPCDSRTVTVFPPAPCPIIWGGESTWSSIPSGTTVTAYQFPSATDPSFCVSQPRACNNGVLTGTYTYQGCPSAPTFSFVPSSATVNPGSPYNLIWSSVTNASAPCTAGGDWSGNNKSLSGGTETMPIMGTSPRVHTLSCTGAGGTTLKTVYVYPVISAPVITYFAPDVTPIPANTSTDLYWNVSGLNTACLASGGWLGSKNSNGGIETTGILTTATTYTLKCSNSAGSDTKSTTVNIIGGPVCNNNNVCDAGENPLNCPKDCKVRYKQF